MLSLVWACKLYACMARLLVMQSMHCWETSVNTLPEIDPFFLALPLDPVAAICWRDTSRDDLLETLNDIDSCGT